MKVKKKLKKILIILLIVVVFAGLGVGGYFAYKSFSKSTKPIENKIVNEIKDYDYKLEDDDPKIYKNLFDELIKILSKSEVDEEEYAKTIAQMMVIDFYTLDNKLSKNDVGGTQFVYSKYVDNFVLEASETVYKYLEHNLYGDRKQQLPIVKSTEVTSIKTNSYSYEKITDDKAYIVTVSVSYEEDLEYPETVVVKMLHTDKKLEVFYMK